MKNGRVVWITGLPGSGKSSAAMALRKLCPRLVVLRMDDLRRLVTPNPTYSEGEREILYRSMVYTAKTLSGLGRDVAIDATGNLRRWRRLARKEISPFAEVYLKCPLPVAIKREEKRQKRLGAPRGVYAKGKKGWPVPGLSAPYEEPRAPELVIETDRVNIEEAARLINALLRGLGKNRHA